MLARFRRLLCLFAVGCAGPLLAEQSAWADDTSNENPDLGALKKMSLEELSQLEVISVSRVPEKLEDAASAIQILASDDIERSAALTLPELLRSVPSLDVAQKNSYDWGITTRGFNTELSNKLLVMFDGRTVYTPLFSGVIWDMQNYILDDLARVEVVSGPGATVWGANAVNGVINIVSKSAAETQGTLIEGSAGNVDHGSFALRYGGQESGVYFRVYAQHYDFDNDVKDGAPANDAWNYNQAGFRADADLRGASHLTVQGDLARGNEEFVQGGASTVSTGNLLTRFSKDFSASSSCSLQVYFDSAGFTQPVPASPFAAAAIDHDRLNTFDIDFQNNFSLSESTRLVWGLGYRDARDDFATTPGLALLPPQETLTLFSGFVQGSVQLSRDVTWTAGTKLEHNSYTGWELQPSTRLQWQPRHSELIWGAISRAVRTPSRVDRDIAEPSHAPIILLGGDDFESETLVAYELGYRAQPVETVALSVSTYYNQYDRIRSLRATPTTVLPLVFANDLEGPTYGGELSATWQALRDWRLSAGWDLLRENIHVRPGGQDWNHALNETADPAHQFTLGSSWDLPHGLSLDGQFRWVDSYRINDNGKPAIVPHYAELNARLAWRVSPRWEISLIGQNLLHRLHVEYYPDGPTQVEIRRSLVVKSDFRF